MSDYDYSNMALHRLKRGQSLSLGPRTAGGLAIAATVLAFGALIACAVALDRALRLDDLSKQIKDDLVLACSIAIAVTGLVVILGSISAYYAYQGYKTRAAGGVGSAVPNAPFPTDVLPSWARV